MKQLKFIAVFLLSAVFAFGLAACDTSQSTEKPKSTATVSLNKTELVLTEFESERLVATTDPVGDPLEFSSDNPEVAIVSPSGGLVYAQAPGTAVITVTATESGNKETCSVTVKEMSVPEVALPEGSIDLSSLAGWTATTDESAAGVTTATVNTETGATVVEYDQEAARDTANWSSYVQMYLADKSSGLTDASKAETLCVQMRGNGQAIQLTMATNTGDRIILKQQTEVPETWTTVRLEITPNLRFRLSDIKNILIQPVPNWRGSADSFKLGAVWFETSEETATEPSGDYNAYTPLVSLDLSKWTEDPESNFTISSEDGVYTAGGGKISATYTEGTGIRIENRSYNDWARFNLYLPENVDYSGAAFLVFQIDGLTDGIVKGQVDWGNMWGTDFTLMSGSASQENGYCFVSGNYYFVDVSMMELSAGMSVSIAPPYLADGKTSASFTIESVQLMRL